MSDSILATIKKMLGLDAAYTAFDTDIIVLINSAFMTLNQIGVGPKEGYSIHDYTGNWTDFVTNRVMLNSVQEYVYMKVKMVFDPPSNSYVMEAMKSRCAEYEVRLNMQAESVEDFSFVEKENNPHL